MKMKMPQKARKTESEAVTPVELKQEKGFWKKHRHKIHVATRILCWFVTIVAVLGVIGGGSFLAMAWKGKQSLRQKTAGSVPNLQLTDTQETEETSPSSNTENFNLQTSSVKWDPDWVQYDGKVYDFNENIIIFLILGIDKNEEVSETSGADGGQSDFMFLAAVNQEEKRVDLIAINRDTMTDVYLYGYTDANGEVPVVTAQITTQHGFGDGKELSCQYSCEAVSALFYGLPIHNYLSMNLAGVPTLNDAVGGVTVTIPEDMTKLRRSWKEGKEITLRGQDSYNYLKWRDITVFESNRMRLERQKQYLKSFAAKAIEAIKADITLPVTLYNELSKYMVTNLSVDEVAYMVSSWLDYDFGTIYSMEGTTYMGEEHEEFYPDYEALRKLILDVFYTEVELPE